MDYEVQYQETIEYVERVFKSNADILDVYRVCVPFKVITCTSMYQQFWRPWDDTCQDIWVREMPEGCYRKEDFPFYTEDMWDYEFQYKFAHWLHIQKKAQRTCCLVGIRTQESYNRWRTIYSSKNYQKYRGLKWTRRCGEYSTMHIRSMIGRQRMYGLQTENSNGTITISMICITKPASLG